MTDSGHELSMSIYLMIPHVNIPVWIHDSDQVSSDDILIRILTRQYISRLPVMKHRVVRDLAKRRTRYWAEELLALILDCVIILE